MKFTCLQENLSKGLNTVFRAVPTRTTLPILGNILIETKDGRIKLSATNTETTISTYIGASVEEEGAITVPAKLLKEFVSTLSPNTLTAYLDENTLHISSQKTKSKFNGIAASDYPQLPQWGSETPHLQLDPKEFLSALGSVFFAAANDETRPLFTGIYLNYTNGVLTIAACDGFRLSEKTMLIETEATGFTTIIPAKTLLEVAKIFSGSQEPIKMILDTNGNQVLFESDETFAATRILDGNYPDYKRIIPQATILSAEFDAEELLEAVRLTNIFAKDAGNPIRLKIFPEGNISLKSHSQEMGEHESNIDAQIEGEALEISFNSKYLLDFLSNVKAERLVLKANGSASPCMIKPIDQENFLHIIMPIQVQ